MSPVMGMKRGDAPHNEFSFIRGTSNQVVTHASLLKVFYQQDVLVCGEIHGAIVTLWRRYWCLVRDFFVEPYLSLVKTLVTHTDSQPWITCSSGRLRKA